MKWAHALALLPVAMPAAAQAPGSPDAPARATLAQMSLDEKTLLGSWHYGHLSWAKGYDTA